CVEALEAKRETFENEPPIAECLNCSQLNEEIVKQLKIEAIKQKILSKLDLNERPKFNSAIAQDLVGEALSNALFSEENKNEFFSDFSLYGENNGEKSEIIAFSKPGRSWNGQTMIEFLLDNQEWRSLEVIEAELLVYLQVSANNDLAMRERNLNLNVFRVKSKNNDSEQKEVEILTKKEIKRIEEGWKRIDFRSPVQVWFSDSQFSKLSVLIECEGCDSLVKILLSNNDNANGNFNMAELTKNNHHLIDEEDNYKKSKDKGAYFPFLVIKTKSKVKQKFKRQTTTCDNKKECCKQELYISFNEIGWDDWIIAPDGFYANYCSGNCSNLLARPDKLPNIHSMALDDYRKNKTLTSFTSCCAPTQYSAISIIYYDSPQNVIKKNFSNMVVEKCGCI
ncbi:Inhibin beta B chain-like protein, partial [Dinothrombium tinctorium]